ncbi:MAG: chain-length determining protein [Bacteroidaceae bacterium]|nr:chain-length determining protein [Bacteroidaceae bacterium]
MSNNKKSDIDVLNQATQILKSKKKSFTKILAITFVLSCLIIFPQPRYYNCEVKLAPEYGSSTTTTGGLGSLAASFGVDLSSMQSSDAIYPLLYPELFESPEFLVPLFNIKVNTLDGKVSTNYHDYLKKHQKKNPLVAPFVKVFDFAKKFFESEDVSNKVNTGSSINPFHMNKKDFGLMSKITDKVKCMVDKKNNVVSIVVKDQDALVCATLADSIKNHLQNFIINYRTSKARQDVAYYQGLRDSALIEYDDAIVKYSRYCDQHQNVILQSVISERDQLENDMALKLTKYQTVSSQLENAKAKVQEQTPAFTVIKSSTVPVKPAGPKRMIFVACMLILAALGSAVWYLRRLILSELI